MSSTTIKVNVDVDTSELAAMRRNMGSYREPLMEGIAFLRTAFGNNFDSSGSMVGGWAPLAPSTSAWRAKNGIPPFAPILVNNGTLRTAVLMGRGDVGAKDATLTIESEIASFHQYGSRKGNLPKREIVFEPPGFADLMARRIRAHIVPDSYANDLKALLP
jgi:hypothetical protein